MAKQLIYVTLDLRRGLWISEATDAWIICSYKSDLLDWMRQRGANIWCFQEKFPSEKLPKTTAELLGNPKTLAWLRSLKMELGFLVFKPSNRICKFIASEGWEVISPNPTTCRLIEDKLSFFELAQKHQIQIPKGKVLLWNKNNINKYFDELGENIIVQQRMGHAGSSTFLYSKRHGGPAIKDGTSVKISKLISGNTFTLNGYIDHKGKVAISPLWQQLMNVPHWNTFKYGTVGISPIDYFDDNELEKLKSLILDLSPLFVEQKYSGFFGLDLIWNVVEKDWFLIECNPRFTASVSLQCMIDFIHKRPSLLKLQAQKIELNANRFDFLSQVSAESLYGQVILRNSKNRSWMIPRVLKSGIYMLDREKRWKLKARSYSATELNKGEMLLILAQDAGTLIEPGSDFATIHYRGTAFVEAGEINDLFFDFYDRIIMNNVIRPKDFYENKYIRFIHNNNENLQDSSNQIRSGLSIWKKPSLSIFSSSNLDKYRVTEALDKEVLQILGEHDSFCLVKRADNTVGWIRRKHPFYEELDATEDEFGLPNKSKNKDDVASFFINWRGRPYRFGGNSEQGIDCSAFVQRYFWETKGVLLPKNSQDQKAMGEEIDRSAIQDDDLVFLRHRENGIPHVGIVREGKVWHSGLERGVQEQDLEQLFENYHLEAFKRL